MTLDIVALALSALAVPTLAVVTHGGRPSPLAHTYSIVARDPRTGEMGVAVQSHYFSVGPVVPWAEAGVGAVATQSLVLVDYGPNGLELMRKGYTARQALDSLLAADDHREGRQVAMVDAKGNVFMHGSCDVSSPEEASYAHIWKELLDHLSELGSSNVRKTLEVPQDRTHKLLHRGQFFSHAKVRRGPRGAFRYGRTRRRSHVNRQASFALLNPSTFWVSRSSLRHLEQDHREGAHAARLGGREEALSSTRR